jgi:hypothetical protein
MDKTQLIEHLEAGHEALRTALEGVDPDIEVCPGWTARGLLAHICGWDEWTIPWFRAVADGDREYGPPWRGIDALNAEFVARREGLGYEDLRRDWARSRERLKAVIGDMPAEALDAPLNYPWGGSGTVAQFALILAEHDEEHAAEIEEARGELAGTN